MPILEPNSKIFGSFEVGDEFVSVLPPGELGRSGALLTLLGRREFVDPYLRNFGNVTQLTASNLGISRGIPDFRMNSFGTIFNEWPKVKAGALGIAATTGAIRGALKIWNRALNDALSDVPIFGWAIDLGVLIYKWIKAVMEARKPERDPVFPAIVYRTDVDQSVANSFLTRVGDRDWTNFFMPITTNPRFDVKKINWHGQDEDGQGRRISIGLAQPSGAGLLPGIADMIGDYQYAFRQGLRSNRPSDPSSLETWGKFFPSSVQFGMGTWEMIMKISPQMYQVNPSRLVSGWNDWYGELTEFKNSHSGQLKKMLEYAISWRGKYRNLNPAGVGPSTADLIKYIITELYEPRLKRGLRTIMCAYVPTNAPALKGAGLKKLHREMRAKLLKHKAVRTVELDMIPDSDSDYRNDVFRAQLPATDDITIRPPSEPQRVPVAEGAPLIVPVPSPLPPNPGPAIPGTGEGGGAGVAIVLVAAAAAAAALLS